MIQGPSYSHSSMLVRLSSLLELYFSLLCASTTKDYAAKAMVPNTAKASAVATVKRITRATSKYFSDLNMVIILKVTLYTPRCITWG